MTDTDRAPTAGEYAIWHGTDGCLPNGARVLVLAIDPECPDERAPCWVRHWPEGRDFPKYRSIDLCDLSLDVPEPTST